MASAHDDMESKLFWAARFGNVEQIRRIAENEKNNELDTKKSILVAAQHDHAQAVQTLIECNLANVNAKDQTSGRSALVTCVTHNSINTLNLLINQSANVNEEDDDGFTPLMHAALSNNARIAEKLLVAGADVVREPVGAREIAASLGHDAVKSIIDRVLSERRAAEMTPIKQHEATLRDSSSGKTLQSNRYNAVDDVSKAIETMMEQLGDKGIEISKQGDDLSFQLHMSEIILLHMDGSLTINSGGWKTTATLEAINDSLSELLPKIPHCSDAGKSLRVVMKDASEEDWLLTDSNGDSKLFEDGVKVFTRVLRPVATIGQGTPVLGNNGEGEERCSSTAMGQVAGTPGFASCPSNSMDGAHTGTIQSECNKSTGNVMMPLDVVIQAIQSSPLLANALTKNLMLQQGLVNVIQRGGAASAQHIIMAVQELQMRGEIQTSVAAEEALLNLFSHMMSFGM